MNNNGIEIPIPIDQAQATCLYKTKIAYIGLHGQK